MEPKQYTAGTAARAAGIPLRGFRHLVMSGFDTPGHTRRKWHRYDLASIVVLAVAGRLTRYGLAPREALAVSVETIEPVLAPVDGNAAILRALRGCRLEVAASGAGFAATLNPTRPRAEAVLVDIETLAVEIIDRLSKESEL